MTPSLANVEQNMALGSTMITLHGGTINKGKRKPYNAFLDNREECQIAHHPTALTHLHVRYWWWALLLMSKCKLTLWMKWDHDERWRLSNGLFYTTRQRILDTPFFWFNWCHSFEFKLIVSIMTHSNQSMLKHFHRATKEFTNQSKNNRLTH